MCSCFAKIPSTNYMKLSCFGHLPSLIFLTSEPQLSYQQKQNTYLTISTHERPAVSNKVGTQYVLVLLPISIHHDRAYLQGGQELRTVCGVVDRTPPFGDSQKLDRNSCHPGSCHCYLANPVQLLTDDGRTEKRQQATQEKGDPQSAKATVSPPFQGPNPTELPVSLHLHLGLHIPTHRFSLFIFLYLFH